MKKIFYLLLLIPSFGIAQNADCKYTFLDSSKLTKTELYKPIRIWISKSFNDSKNVIQMDDKELGTIICKGKIAVDGAKNFLGTPVGDDYVSFTLSIDIKDYKYRIVYDELIHKAGNYSGSHNGGNLCNDKPSSGGSLEFSKKRWHKVKSIVGERINSLYEDLKNQISKTDTF